MKQINLSKLRDNLPCKWRIQSAKNGWAICVAYIDARDAQNILDEVCGPENWQSRHKDVGGKLYCEIGIRVDSEWIWKSDVGKETSIESEKGEASDSFKRAAVQWGIGRFLYNMGIMKIRAIEKDGKWYPVIEERNDEIIYSGDTLTKYLEWIRAGKPQKAA